MVATMTTHRRAPTTNAFKKFFVWMRFQQDPSARLYLSLIQTRGTKICFLFLCEQIEGTLASTKGEATAMTCEQALFFFHDAQSSEASVRHVQYHEQSPVQNQPIQA